MDYRNTDVSTVFKNNEGCRNGCSAGKDYRVGIRPWKGVLVLKQNPNLTVRNISEKPSRNNGKRRKQRVTLGGNLDSHSQESTLKPIQKPVVPADNLLKPTYRYGFFTCKYCGAQFEGEKAEHSFYEHLKTHGVNN